MNRRMFAAAVAAMIPATVAGQDPTPGASAAQSTLESVLFDVIRDGKISQIPDLFAPTVDIDAMMVDMGDLSSDLYLDETTAFELVMIAADGTEAMAMVQVGERRRLFVYIDTNDDGQIEFIVWSGTLV